MLGIQPIGHELNPTVYTYVLLPNQNDPLIKKNCLLEIQEIGMDIT